MAKEPARASNGSRPGINDDIGEEKRLTLYRLQVEIRESEQRAFDLFLQNLVKGTSHLSLGQEAVAAGFAAAMKPGDLSFCTYRGHAHTLARGVPIEKVLGELMQRDNGLMRGKGGSMHLTSVEHGVMGSYAIIGAHLPIACGAALRAQYKGDSDVTVCFFGDGTTNIGAFHEALNFAAVWKLPVIFVCENNLYMEYTPIGEVTAVEHPAADALGPGGLQSRYELAHNVFIDDRFHRDPSLLTQAGNSGIPQGGQGSQQRGQILLRDVHLQTDLFLCNQRAGQHHQWAAGREPRRPAEAGRVLARGDRRPRCRTRSARSCRRRRAAAG